VRAFLKSVYTDFGAQGASRPRTGLSPPVQRAKSKVLTNLLFAQE